MKARTKLFLYQLLWTAGMTTRPTFRNFFGSFESWAYRNGFMRQVRELERQNILESTSPQHSTERVFRLTEAGRRLAMGERDPEKLWARPWDGKWRMVVFDLPESQRSLRASLRRTLSSSHLGCLQQSVWVTPDRLDPTADRLRSLKVDVGTLILFEGKPCGGESDAEIVLKAWNFPRINRTYARYTDHLRRFAGLQKKAAPDKLLDWLTEERALWMTCLSQDPLLPGTLLPRDYAGRKAWDQRRLILSRFGRTTKGFTDLL